MNKSFILSLVFLTGFTELSAGAPPLSEESLSDGFEMNHIIGSAKLTFDPGSSSYDFSYSLPGVELHDAGRYTVENSTVRLQPGKCTVDWYGRDPNDCSNSLGNAVCKISPTPESLYYQNHLECTSTATKQSADGQEIFPVLFPIASSAVLTGSRRKFQEIPVITMGRTPGITTTDVKIRKAPRADAQSVDYSTDLFGGDTFPYVPSGTEVTVIARTPAKVKVQKWTNYWYLVNAGVNSEVWMFGEFVKLDR